MTTASAGAAAASGADSSASADRLPNAWRVEVFKRPEQADPEGAHALAALHELELTAVVTARLGRGTLLSPGLQRDQVERIAREVLADPVLDEIRVLAPGECPAAAPDGWQRVLCAPLPGVMDPVAESLRALLVRSGLTRGVEDLEVATFRAWELEGSPAAAELREAARRVLCNETIEALSIGSEALPFGVPTGTAQRGRVELALLDASDDELQRVSRDGQLSLSLVEMQEIQKHFAELGREPSLAELETIAQTWSEHCKHKTLTGLVDMQRPDGSVERIDNLLKSTIARATHELDKEWCWSVFVDNAGTVQFEGDWGVCFKVETHNHPSAIDPYGGAGTGIGGVIRDILGAGLGAKPIANTDAFCVGPLDLAPEELPKGSMHPRRILRGVVSGVRDYGNRMGIPTVSGGLWVHEGYVGNPLIYAGTVGLLKREHVEKSVAPGDAIVAVGGRTGRDGIHGATFSSIELSEDSETVSSHAVQIGNAIQEKGVLDCLLAARDAGLYRGVTDCGAGGFSSAVGEMGEETGAEVWLDRAPLKYPGLSSHEVWISEAQERMVLSVPPDKLDALLPLFAAEDVEAVQIGVFTDDKRLVLKDGDEVVGDMAMEFLHDGTPRVVRQAEFNAPAAADPGAPGSPDLNADVVALLGSPNICSREWIIRQYDHEVQARTVLRPLVGERADGPGDGSVLQPLPDSKRGLAIGCGGNPRTGRLDPWAMAAANIDEALRNVVAVGADPTRAALLDNFSWGNCDKPHNLGALVLSAEACYDAAMAYGAPFISGKDSLHNEYRVGDQTLSIPPTLLISCIAPVPDLTRAVSMDLKASGNRLYLVGATRCELGGSEYLVLRDLDGGAAPRPDLTRAPQLFQALHGALAQGLAESCHDLAEGGLAVGAAEMAFAGERGLEIDLGSVPFDGDCPGDANVARLFSESCSRFLVEVRPDQVAAFEAALAGQPFAAVGEVAEHSQFRVRGVDGAALIDLPIASLRSAHQSGFQG
ncbi:MAG: phosphoribosylformylglycinamidine synthase subunit PurL [Planctomycetota bacterium]|jgi:phosphoribosylformylglycinamidine synthase